MGTSLTCSLSQIYGKFTLACKMIRFTMQASDSVGSSTEQCDALLAHLVAYFYLFHLLEVSQ